MQTEEQTLKLNQGDKKLVKISPLGLGLIVVGAIVIGFGVGFGTGLIIKNRMIFQERETMMEMGRRGPMGEIDQMPPPEITDETTIVISAESREIPDTTDYSGGEVQNYDLGTVDGNELKITATAGEKYSLTGKFSGQVIVEVTNGQAMIELNNVEIDNSSGVGPALLIKNNDLAIVTLRAGTENVLNDGSENEDYDATLFAVEALAINGAGSLTVTGNSQEGIASDVDLTIQNGNIKVTAMDDGLNAQTGITINGGNLLILAEGDGIDSNGSLTVNGGTIVTQSGLVDASGGFDADGVISITGGKVIATGANNETPRNGTESTTAQKFLLVNFGSSVMTNSELVIKKDGQAIETFVANKPYTQLLYSSEEIEEGVEYEIYVDGNLQSTVTNSTGNARNPGGGGGRMGNGVRPMEEM